MSHTQDKGQTFNFDSIPGLEFATIDNGFLSRQGVFDKSWYWFVQADSTTLSFVKTIAAPACTTLTFDDLPPGTIVTDQLASIGLTISAENNKHSHPDAAIIFNSANPTGEDFDLGTPNEEFGGPGIGEGGQAGEPGENAIPLGNLLIIAEDIIDVDPHDGLVDDPDDEAKGGHIQFNFEFISTVQSITLVDIDSNENGGSVMVMTTSSGDTITISIEALGDNSVQTIAVDLDDVTDFKVELVSSGAIATIDYCLGTEPVPEPEEEVIDEDTTGNQNVGPGEILRVTNGATVTGNITVDGGTLILEDNCTIVGNVESTNGGNVSINSCTINGNVKTTDGGTLTITNETTVTKNVNSKNADSVSITHNLNSFEKNVRVDSAAIVDISDNTITENLRVKNSGDVDLFNNSVGGHLRALDNTQVAISGNTVGGNLNTDGSDTVVIQFNQVTGNVRAGDGLFVQLLDNTSGENLRVKNVDSASVDGNTVGKNLQVKDSDVVFIGTNSVTGNLNSANNVDFNIAGNTVTGNVSVKGGIIGFMDDNIITGKLRVQDTNSAEIDSNQVTGNISIQKNTNIEVDQNTSGNNLSVRNNDGVTVTENHATNKLTITKNTDCTHADNTADGKIRIRDCTELPP